MASAEFTVRLRTAPQRCFHAPVGGRALPKAVLGLMAVGAVLTVLDVAGEAPAAFGQLPGRVILDTIATTSAALVALLMLGRFQQQRLLRDLLLCEGLLFLALGNFAFSVVPVMVSGSEDRDISVAPVFVGVLTAATFALAAFQGNHRSVTRGRTVSARNTVTLAVVAQLLLALYLGSLFKPQPAVSIGSAETFGTSTNRLLSVTELATAALFLVAAFGLARRADDRLTGAFAVAAVLAGISRVNFAIATSPSSEHVLTGDAFRLAFHAVLVLAAVSEIRRYWRQASEAAVLEERRRIARELHDGLAQELAFVVTHGRRLGGAGGQVVAAAAERALDESRRAIAALTRPLDEPFELQLTQTAEEVAGRLGARVRFQIEPGINPAGDKREALLRITREAVTNAARHGNADRIFVVLSNHNGIQLQVVDNGTGFDAADRNHLSGRFGLISMRERCEALQGAFSVTSAPDRGTTVRAWVP